MFREVVWLQLDLPFLQKGQEAADDVTVSPEHIQRYQKAYRERNREKLKAYFREYNKKRRGDWKWRSLTPEYRARQAVARACKSGKLSRPGLCSECGGACKPHGHHEDYSKPLEVVWLCQGCHIERHRRDG